MGRKIQIRVSYQSDARYLSRLMESVEKDPKMSVGEQREVVSKLRDVCIIFTKQAGKEA